MSSRRKRTAEEVWKALEAQAEEAELARIERLSDEELDRELRQAGIDPDAIAGEVPVFLRAPDGEEAARRDDEDDAWVTGSGAPAATKRPRWAWLVAAALVLVALAIALARRSPREAKPPEPAPTATPPVPPAPEPPTVPGKPQ